jgi:hypothetical protein
MSDETAPPPEISANPAVEGAARTRRISNPRPKKSATHGKEPAGKATPAFPVFDSPEAPAQDAPQVPSAADWPEPEPPSAPENPKRKRRRKKGKGGNPQNAPQTAAEDDAPAAPAGETPQARPAQPPRVKADSEALAKLALKIYLSEVSEEGVALIGDNDAKELSRRCFRLAEIFIEEQSRRR